MLATYGAGYGLLILKVIPKLYQDMKLGDFLKQYPDFNVDTDIKDVEKALEKYEELLEFSENIEEKKCEHLTNLPDEVKKMSTQEKLAYLEREKEFWEQVEIKERDGNKSEEESYQKRI